MNVQSSNIGSAQWASLIGGIVPTLAGLQSRGLGSGMLIINLAESEDRSVLRSLFVSVRYANSCARRTSYSRWTARKTDLSLAVGSSLKVRYGLRC
jgi:hypothetical protein